MHICIVSPSAQQCYNHIKRSSKRQPSLGPAYLLASLKNKGYEVSYIDADALDLTGEKAAESILAHNPDIIGISLTTPLFSEAREISKLLREKKWSGTLVLGGIHPSALPEETLSLIPEADIIIKGEGEEMFVSLADCIANKKTLEDIPGLIFRNNKKEIHFNKGFSSSHKNIDSLPLPALEYYPMDKYISEMWVGNSATRMGVLITSRGCAYTCEFCASGTRDWGLLRFHSIERVVTEIRRLIDIYKAEYLVFNDDTFTILPDRCRKIFNKMEDEDIHIPFMVTARADTITQEFVQDLVKAGCFLVTLGIESGSDDILKSIGKRITKSQVSQSVMWLKEAGIKVIGNFMFGHYKDTYDTCQQTIDFAHELCCDISQFAICIPYPGTKLYQRAMAEKRILPTTDYSNWGYYGNMPWRHPVLSEETLINFQKKAYWKDEG